MAPLLIWEIGSSPTIYLPLRPLRHAEDPPWVGDAFQYLFPPVGEQEAGSRKDVPHRCGHQDLIAGCQRRNPCRDVNGDPSQVIARSLHLTDVHACPQPKAKTLRLPLNRLRAANGADRALERRHDLVADQLCPQNCAHLSAGDNKKSHRLFPVARRLPAGLKCYESNASGRVTSVA